MRTAKSLTAVRRPTPSTTGASSGANQGCSRSSSRLLHQFGGYDRVVDDLDALPRNACDMREIVGDALETATMPSAHGYTGLISRGTSMPRKLDAR